MHRSRPSHRHETSASPHERFESLEETASLSRDVLQSALQMTAAPAPALTLFTMLISHQHGDGDIGTAIRGPRQMRQTARLAIAVRTTAISYYARKAGLRFGPQDLRSRCGPDRKTNSYLCGVNCTTFGRHGQRQQWRGERRRRALSRLSTIQGSFA